MVRKISSRGIFQSWLLSNADHVPPEAVKVICRERLSTKEWIAYYKWVSQCWDSMIGDKI